MARWQMHGHNKGHDLRVPQVTCSPPPSPPLHLFIGSLILECLESSLLTNRLARIKVDADNWHHFASGLSRDHPFLSEMDVTEIRQGKHQNLTGIRGNVTRWNSVGDGTGKRNKVNGKVTRGKNNISGASCDNESCDIVSIINLWQTQDEFSIGASTRFLTYKEVHDTRSKPPCCNSRSVYLVRSRRYFKQYFPSTSFVQVSGKNLWYYTHNRDVNRAKHLAAVLTRRQS